MIIPSFDSSATIERCLEALDHQRTPHPYEVIVVDSSADDSCEAVTRRFSRVRLIRLPERRYPGGARNAGVASAVGDILAFTDADCIPDADWVSEIVAAHRSSGTLVGGVIDNGNPDSLVGWAYYFSEFSRWMPGQVECELPDLATGCLSMKRSLFDQCGPFLDGTYSSDTAFCWRARDQGHAARFLPSMRVRHLNVTGLGEFFRRKYARGRAFARVRAHERRFSRLQACGRALAAPALPALLFARLLRDVARQGAYRHEFLLSSPLVIAALLAWSFGESWGYAESVWQVES